MPASVLRESISTDQLRDLLASGHPVIVVDIRSADDRAWSIPGSLQFDAYEAVRSGSLGPLASLDFRPGPVVTVTMAAKMRGG